MIVYHELYIKNTYWNLESELDVTLFSNSIERLKMTAEEIYYAYPNLEVSLFGPDFVWLQKEGD